MHVMLRTAIVGGVVWIPSLALGQTFESTGSDFSPVNVNGKVVTNAHDDATGLDTSDVRVSAYAFAADPEDPNFTQDPGFNTPAGGLPVGATLSIGSIDSLKYWNGIGPVQLGLPANGESIVYNFGSTTRIVTGSSGNQGASPINLGAVTSAGSIHKHLNAFLANAAGDYDPSADPTPGVYVAQIQANVTGLTPSDPLFAVYSNGATQSQVDRAKFYLRNHDAPGSALLGAQTSMIGLSAQPGEANLATGGQVTVTHDGGGYHSQINELTTNANKGSVVINSVSGAGSMEAMLYLSGTSADIASLIANLDIPDGYDIAASTVAASDPLYADIHALQPTYGNFSALVKFDPTADNSAFTWDFSANPSVVLDRIAVVPEPTTASLVLIGGTTALVRRRPRSRGAPHWRTPFYDTAYVSVVTA